MSRRILQTAAAVSLLWTGAFGVGVAHADNVSQGCKSVNDAGVSHGACVSLGEAGNPTPLFSDLCKMPGFPQAVGTTNHGQCIQALRASAPPS
jgi:hypothetical protein